MPKRSELFNMMMMRGRGGVPFASDVFSFHRSDIGVSVDGSNNVTNWADQSGNGNDLVKSPEGFFDAMTYDGVTVNGLDTGNQRLEINTPGLYNFLTSGAGGSIYIVCSYVSTADTLRPFFSTKTAGIADAGIYAGVNGSLDAIITQVGNGTANVLNDTAANNSGVPGAFATYTWRLGNVSPRIKVDRDNTNYESTDGSNLLGGTSSVFTLNAIDGNSASSDASYKAILVYNKQHTDEEAAIVRNYLASQFRTVDVLGGYVTNSVVVDTTDDATSIIEAQTGEKTSMTQVVLKSGTHSLTSQADIPDWVGVVGQGEANTRVEFYQPDGASGADIATFSAFDPDENCFITDMTVSARNARYAIHPEILFDDKQLFRNLTVEHLGNPSPNNFWPVGSQNAFGCGTRSGATIVIENCTVSGQQRAITTHNNVDFTEPSQFIIRDSVMNNLGANATQVSVAYSQDINGSSIGRQQPCLYTVENCTGNGGAISYEYLYNAGTYDLTPDVAPALGDFVNTYINSPSFWFAGNDPSSSLRFRQEALKITSNDTSDTAAVAITGDLTLFGNDYTGGAVSKPLGAGLGSYVAGTFDVNSIYSADNAMGPRLGDCSVVNKVFTLTQGSTSETVAFDQDFTSTSNGDILTFINNQLSSFTAELYVPMRDYFPSHDSVTLKVTNVGSKSVQMGMGAKILSNTTARIAEQADSSDIGIWVDETAAGAKGRVLYLGQGSFNYLREFITGVPADNTDIGIGTTDGVFVTSPTNASYRINGTATIGESTVGLEPLLAYTPT